MANKTTKKSTSKAKSKKAKTAKPVKNAPKAAIGPMLHIYRERMLNS